MAILSKLFSSKTLNINDPDLGLITKINKSGRKIIWQANRHFLGFDIEVLIQGNKNGINKIQKEILLEALKNESLIKLEAEKALRAQFQNSVMDFTSLEELFDVIEISLNDDGFTLTCQEKDGQFVFFNIHFENNKETNITIEDF